MASFCHQCGLSIQEQEDVRIATSDPLLDTAPGRSSAQAETVETPADRVNRAGRRDQDAERALWDGGYSLRAMAPLIALLILITLGAIAICISSGATLEQWGTVGAIFVAGSLGLLVRFVYLRLHVHYYLTTRRLIHEEGIFHRVSNRIDVITIDDVVHEQNIIERLIGVGTIRILSSEVHEPKIIMKGINHVDQITSMIDSARLEERERRGLHIETM